MCVVLSGKQQLELNIIPYAQWCNRNRVFPKKLGFSLRFALSFDIT